MLDPCPSCRRYDCAVGYDDCEVHSNYISRRNKMSKVDECIYQVKVDTQRLQASLNKLETEKKRLQVHVAVVGDVLVCGGNYRLVVKTCDGLRTIDKRGCRGNSCTETVQGLLDSGTYQRVGNIFAGTVKWEFDV